MQIKGRTKWLVQFNCIQSNVEKYQMLTLLSLFFPFINLIKYINSNMGLDFLFKPLKLNGMKNRQTKGRTDKIYGHFYCAFISKGHIFIDLNGNMRTCTYYSLKWVL